MNTWPPKPEPPLSETLLNAIPEELRDTPHEGLEGMTPRQVVEAGHVDSTPDSPACHMCIHTLRHIANPRWFERFSAS